MSVMFCPESSASVRDDLILICAFRYALGRSTYVVAEVADEIRRRRHAISELDRALILREIDHALENDLAGMQMDREQWEETRNVLLATRIPA